MTEEQRWKQKYQIEVDRNKCLKGIWDELKNITGLMKIQACISPGVVGSRLTANDLISLVNALENPAQFVPTVEEVPEPPKPVNACEEKLADVFKYEDFSSALDKDWEKTGDYSNFKSNGEWHGEHIDPSDPCRK